MIDLYTLKSCDEAALAAELSSCGQVITMEEAFINNGGLDCLVSKVIREHGLSCRLYPVGVNDRYVFDLGSRDQLHALNNMDESAIISLIDHLRVA